MFLKYDPKDVIIAICGFIYGPVSALIVTTVVSFVEMMTVSDTGYIGLIMNIISTGAFACFAALIYKKKRTLWGAVIGLLVGTVLMTGLMILWNYLITPIYLGYPREAVAAMLVPVFLPFNLLKCGLNTALTLLLYKPVTKALSAARLMKAGDSGTKTKLNIGLLAAAGLLLATCVLIVLVWNGVI